MRAFVIGNVAVDETLSVSSLPEAGASIFGRQESRDLGGKGANQAIVMARAGLATRFVTAVGDDFRAEFVRGRLGGEPVEARLLALAGVATDLSIVLTTADGENAIVTTTAAVESLTAERALAAVDDAVPGDLVVLQGNLTEAATAEILAAARARGLVTAFNPSPLRPSFAAAAPRVDVLFVNRGEAEALSGRTGAEAAVALAAAGATVVMTLGGDGAVLAGADGVRAAVPVAPAAVVDTTGAGDTFMGVALASAGLRGTAVDAVALGHAARAAALTVSRRGTASAFPTTAELAAILRG